MTRDRWPVTIRDRGRAQIIEILAELRRTRGKQMAGVEFGSTANALFPLVTIGTSLSDDPDRSSTTIQADNGSTNYNAAFALAKTQNPNANARIFLSDGEHNVGTYTNGHLTPTSRPTWSRLGNFDPTILNKIVADTGGELFRSPTRRTSWRRR